MKSLTWNAASVFVATLLLAVSCTSGSDPAGLDRQDDDTDDNAASRAIPANAVNEIDPNRTEYSVVSKPEGPTVEAQPNCTAESDDQLIIGGLLPQSGNLQYLQPAQAAAIEFALNDIEEAGGVSGREVIFRPGISGSNRTSALGTAQSHIDDGADVIFGPLSSVLSEQITSEITGACRIHISSANTAVGFEELDQNQLYFRTVASDRLQGQALSDIVAESAADNVFIIAEQGTYGQPLAQFTAEALDSENINVTQASYDPAAPDFNAVADAATAASPDATVVIGFEESGQIIKELLNRGLSTETIYLSDGNAGNALGGQFTAPNELDGLRGVLPGADASARFRNSLSQLDGNIDDFSFSPEAYDAIIIVALAAQLAQSDAAPDIARRINGVTSGGSSCTSFAQCKSRIINGETDINYNGESGNLEFNSNGEPTEAEFAVVEFG